MHNLFKDEFKESQPFISGRDFLNFTPEETQGEDVLNFHFGKVPVQSSFEEKDRYVSLLDEIQEGLKEKTEIIEELKKDVEVPKKKKISGAYYKVNNHDELYKLGATFTPDIEVGQSIFAFTASENNNAVRDVVTGLAAHFEFHTERAITIISHQDHISYYQEIFKGTDRVEIQSFASGLELNKKNLTLWEVPSGRTVLKKIEDYFPAITKIDSCSIVVSQNMSQFSKINKLKQFYSKYNVKIKGLIFEEGVR